MADMIEPTRQFGRYTHRRMATLPEDSGWQVTDMRVERLWRREGLKVPMKQPKKGRLWLNYGLYVRINAVGAKTNNTEPGPPCENRYCESFNARFRDAFLNGEIFYRLREAQIRIEDWRKQDDTKRPLSALGYRPPAPETIAQMDPRPLMHSQSN